MGQQQLLLILLGIIIVGIAIFMGINLFRANAIEAKRNNVTNELVNLAAMAQKYYLSPKALGGGERSFLGWDIPSELRVTANGNYKKESISRDSLVILGTGNEVVTSDDSIKVKITVKATTYKVTIIN
ncbi:hypothetical protein [Rosettibacter firmus]|uniref:hypothetical protein n=1 Tax=Rosettibacter firmus TaxID=3111522 RepID=UPI00336C104B